MKVYKHVVEKYCVKILTRRVFTSGGSSYILTLPKEWVERNKVRPGDTVTLYVGDDMIVMRASRDSKVREAVIDARELSDDSLARRIISYYLIGYNKIVIRLHRDDHRRSVRKALDVLVGADVMEDTGRDVTIEVFLNNSYDVHDLLRRISNICISMLSDLSIVLREFDKYICNTIIAREHEVDKLNMLVLRQLNFMVSAQYMLCTIWTCSRRLERISDHVAACAYNMLKLGEPAQFLQPLADLALSVLRDATSAFLSNNAKLADSVIRRCCCEDVVKLESEAYQTILKQEVSKALVLKSILDSLMRVCAYSTDIAEIAIDRACYAMGSPT